MVSGGAWRLFRILVVCTVFSMGLKNTHPTNGGPCYGPYSQDRAIEGPERRAWGCSACEGR